MMTNSRCYRAYIMNINDKSIEELENDYWEDSDFNSYIVQTTQNARKKPVSQLSDEEIRLLIGQKIGLKYLIPIALSLISKDPLVEVTFYKGDLLSQLLKLSYNDWEQNEEDLKYFQKIINDNLTLIQSCDEISIDLIARYLEG